MYAEKNRHHKLPSVQPIIRRFFGDSDIMHMAFADARRGDADEGGFCAQIVNGAAPGVTHRRTDPAD